MISRLPEYFNYTNKFIPVSTDSTVLKIVKLSGLIFFGPLAFIVDYARKVLADRNITKEEGSGLSSLVEKTLDNAETKHVDEMNLVVQNALAVDLSSIAETPGVLLVIEQASIPTDKYSASLSVQKKRLETYLLEKFQLTSQDLLKNLKQFVAGKFIDFKFVPIFGKGPVSIHKHLIKIVERLLTECSNNELNDYKKYTCDLREAINTKEYKNNSYLKIALIIQELCFAKFVYTVLTDFEEKTLESVIKFDLSRNMTSNNISKWIEEDNKILRKQPKGVRQSFSLNCEKVCNAAGINSDQLSSANIPELRSIHKVKQGTESYDVYYIRYPTPTIETKQSFLARFKGDNATAIAPEFIGFLDCIQRKKIPFLHVNHQYMDKKHNDSWLSADNNRAEAIQRLEETYAESFHFLSLPFDGPVIDEIDKESLIKWKQNLVSSVVGEKKGFKLPKKFRKSATSKKKEIRVLDELHSLYFPKKSELNKTERRVLLVIFYSYLKEYFKSEYQIRIMASVCKDNKDRGNVSACIDEALLNLRLGKENDQQALKELHLRILSPFIFREEGIVAHRLQFLTDLLDHIATLGNDQKEKIRAFKVNEQYQVIGQRIPRFNEEVSI